MTKQQVKVFILQQQTIIIVLQPFCWKSSSMSRPAAVDSSVGPQKSWYSFMSAEACCSHTHQNLLSAPELHQTPHRRAGGAVPVGGDGRCEGSCQREKVHKNRPFCFGSALQTSQLSSSAPWQLKSDDVTAGLLTPGYVLHPSTCRPDPRSAPLPL